MIHLLRTSQRVQRLLLSVVRGTNTKAYLIEVSDQRGTCRVERPARVGCVSDITDPSFVTRGVARLNQFQAPYPC